MTDTHGVGGSNPSLTTKIYNMTKEELIKKFKSNLQSDKIQLDNLDWARLVFDEEGEVVVENEHGTQFPIDDLSQIELEIFMDNV